MLFQKRIEQFKKDLGKKLDGVLITSVSNITYLTGYSNFSVEEREAYLLLTKDKSYIFTDARYAEAIKKSVPHFELKEINQKTPLKEIILNLSKKHDLIKIGIEEDDLKVTEHKFFSKHFNSLKKFETQKSRSVKTDEEIKLIKKACQIGDKAFEYILNQIKIGISEKELASKLEIFIKKQDGAALSFETIVAFGPNSSVPHHQTGDTMLKNKNGQFVLLDFGVKYKNYCSDMTRTVFFGPASGKQKKIYEVVLVAQHKAVEYIQENCNKEIILSKVDKVAREYITSKGFPSIPHSLGHGIGLQVHEHPSLSPKSKDILKPGMVFSIEPGIYLEEFGGVRIEDLFVFDGKKVKSLTNASKKLTHI